jgi:hypothetical protein
METWKDINGYKGLYQVSNFGRVKSLRNNIYLKQIKTKKGYLAVSLCNNGKQLNIHTHRLIALYFCLNENGKNCINHIDGNKENNNASNLEWVTYKENNSHADENLLRDIKGKKHPNSKLNDEIIFFIRSNEKIIARKELSKLFNVSIRLIGLVQTRKIWKHI